LNKTLTTAAPTRKLRDLIQDLKYGAADADDLHNALLELEVLLKLPVTEPIDA
jgi:hypothetical protein